MAATTAGSRNGTPRQGFNAVSLWVKSTAGGGIFSINNPAQGGENDRNGWLSGTTANYRVWQSSSEETVTTPATTVTDGNWHQVVLQYSAATGNRIYVDGVLSAYGDAAFSAFNWKTRLEIGWANRGAYFNGQIDDVAVWNEALTPAQISGLYAGTSPVMSLSATTRSWADGTAEWSTGTWSPAGAPGDADTVTVNNGGTLAATAVRFDGGTLRADAAFNVSAPVDVGTGGATVDTVAGVDATLGGAIVGPGRLTKLGAGSLTKVGSGVLTLSGPSSYTGGTTVSAGTLALTSGNDRLSTSGAITVNGGILDLGANTQSTSGAVSVTSGYVQNGTINKTGADYNMQNGVVLASLSGTVGLAKSGSGTVSLGATNTFTGPVTISGGTLKIDVASGSSLWLDATDTAHISKDGSNVVTTWADKTGKSVNVTQGTAAQRPTYVDNQINGLPVIHFSTAGTVDRLYNNVNYTSPVTIFSLSQLTGGVNGRLISSSAGNWLLGYWGGSMDQGYFEGWVSPTGGTPADANNPHMYEAVIRGAGSNSDLYVYDNRNPSVVQVASNQGGASGPSGLSLGTWSASSEASDGDVGEVLIFSGALTAVQRQAVENYLINKWFGGAASQLSDITFHFDGPMLPATFWVPSIFSPGDPTEYLRLTVGVPEPGTLVLAALALLALGLCAPRRRARGAGCRLAVALPRYRWSTMPASMYYPPRVWRQWMAITFLPGFSVARASGVISSSS